MFIKHSVIIIKKERETMLKPLPWFLFLYGFYFISLFQALPGARPLEVKLPRACLLVSQKVDT